MASNAFANAAAAVSAGYIKTQTDRGVAPIGAGNAKTYPDSERYQTILSKPLSGVTGEPSVRPEFIGFGADANAADAAAVANLNAFRANRYGGDSAAASSALTGTTKDAASASKKHTKDST